MKASLRTHKNMPSRRAFLEKTLGISLARIGSGVLDESSVREKNCENVIGATLVPLGVAGPLVFSGMRAGKTEVYVPLATTEGALVASVSRGAKALTLSGGADVESVYSGPTRAPVFHVRSALRRRAFEKYIGKHFGRLKKAAEATSGHLTLRSYRVAGAGRYVFLRLDFDTQDAMGMNMATIASDEVVRVIEKETDARCVGLSGNACTDKKPSWMNVITGRGYRVLAETVLPRAVLRDVLKTTPERMYETWLAKCMLGSAVSGSMGFNAHYANIVAAVFCATGQDIAHVVEGSAGITTTEVEGVSGGGVYASVCLPNLLVGTVGGGTGLGTQSEALKMLGVFGGDGGRNAQRLAEIIGASVLAGEISLLASLSEGSLVRAHRKLGRGDGV